MKNYFWFRLANHLYKYTPALYVPMYRCYKILSDRIERKLIESCIKSGDHVVDIGANIGIYTEFFSAKVGPSGMVYAFEPDWRNFYFLQKHTRSLQNVKIHQAAISDRSGELTLYQSDDLNVDHRTYQTDEHRASQMIPCFSLDDYLGEQKIDFIKMDIQGYEYFALQGMKETLSRNRQIRMITEFWPYGLAQAGHEYQEVLELLRAAGFDIYLFLNEKLVTFSDEFIQCEETDYYNLFVSRQAGFTI